MDRDGLVFLARLTEQAERYEEMRQHTKSLATLVDDELTVEERNLLSVAYKNAIGSRRAAWRVVASLESKQTASKDAQQLVTAYKQTLANEVVEICGELLALVDQYVLPKTSTDEALVFLYKSKADYYRYLTEVQTGETREQTALLALDAYSLASKLAMAELPPTHPVRLGLALNFSVFFYETLHARDRACAVAKTAFDDAIAELDSLEEDSYRDSTLVMQLLRDNLTLWASDEEEEADDEEATTNNHD